MAKEKVDFKGENSPVPENFSMPAAGIEDMDRALFDLFDKRLSFEFAVDDETRKVPVVFSTGERFALTRRIQPIRDNNNAIILPIIAIRRTSIDHDPSQGGYGTPIAFRDQPVYVVKKRLAVTDRKYQNIINKLELKHQKNVSSRGNFELNDVFPGNIAKPGTVASRRNDGNLAIAGTVKSDTLNPDLGNNVFEIITIPYPNFITLNYEVVFWAQYMMEMNKMIESLVAQFDGQDQGFFLTSQNDYEYMAYIKSPFSAQDNFQDFSSEERVIKCSFNIVIPGYILAPQHAGLEIPFRSYLSAPTLDFGYFDVTSQVVIREKGDDRDSNQFILSDIDYDSGDLRRGQSSADIVEVIENPFTDDKRYKFSKVLLRNQRAGETVAKGMVVTKTETQSD